MAGRRRGPDILRARFTAPRRRPAPLSFMLRQGDEAGCVCGKRPGETSGRGPSDIGGKRRPGHRVSSEVAGRARKRGVPEACRRPSRGWAMRPWLPASRCRWRDGDGERLPVACLRRQSELSGSARTTFPTVFDSGGEGGRGSTALSAGPMTAGLVGSERVRRHPHRRARSAPQCGVSRGPRACRVRVPILADPSPCPAVADRPSVRRPAPNPCYSAASAIGAVASQIVRNSSRRFR